MQARVRTQRKIVNKVLGLCFENRIVLIITKIHTVCVLTVADTKE